MSALRLTRPAYRASIQHFSAQRLLRPMAAAAFSTKPAVTQTQQAPAIQKRGWSAPPPPPGKNMLPIKAAMPQLIPFYFVNEVTFTFTILPLLIYIFSKYLLPKQMRLYAARLFISKS